jgi:hypothetical protein
VPAHLCTSSFRDSFVVYAGASIGNATIFELTTVVIDFKPDPANKMITSIVNWPEQTETFVPLVTSRLGASTEIVVGVSGI